MNALIGVLRPEHRHRRCTTTCTRRSARRTAGPRRGPVGVAAHLIDFLPDPVVVREGTDAGLTTASPPQPIHRPHSQLLGALQPHTRLHLHPHAGSEGLRNVAEHAVLNANYLRCRVRDTYHVPYDRTCMHEFVAEGRISGTRKRYGRSEAPHRLAAHPPTMYFPLIVHDALMIEPTETEPSDHRRLC